MISRTLSIVLSLMLLACAPPFHPKNSAAKGGKREAGQAAGLYFAEGMKSYILSNNAEAKSWFENALKSKQDMAASNYMLAKIYLQENKNAEALSYAEKALKLDEKNKYYYEIVARLYERLQNFDEASKVYKKLLLTVPHTEEYNYDLAANYVFQQNFSEALKVYSKIESIYGKSPELTRQKQQLYLKLNKLEMAITEGDALIKEFPDEVDYKLIQAEILYSNNKIKEGISFLEGVIKEYPENGQARLLLLEMYRSQNMQEKVGQQLEFIFNNPEIDLNNKIAVLEDFKKQNLSEESKKNLITYTDILLKNYPEEGSAHAVAADVYLLLNKKTEAWSSFIQAKKYDPGNFNTWNKLIILDSELNKPDSMILHSDQALEVFPNQSVLWLYSGSAYLMKKDSQKAIDALEQGKRLSSTNAALQNEFNVRLGDSYHENKDFGKSDEAYKEALKFDKNNPHVLNNYSYYLSLRRERLEDAKTMSFKLVTQYPDNSTYLDTYAWVLYMMKEYQEARKYLEIAVKKSNNGTIVEHYGDVLFMLGEKDKALEQWKKAKSMGETSEALDKKIKDKNIYE
ncbi:MAG TPA: tetratricopeptide repeat protein [Cytophagaceae bacterium]|jgi:tetratricopeptide (TPR) repeat protein